MNDDVFGTKSNPSTSQPLENTFPPKKSKTKDTFPYGKVFGMGLVAGLVLIIIFGLVIGLVGYYIIWPYLREITNVSH